MKKLTISKEEFDYSYKSFNPDMLIFEDVVIKDLPETADIKGKYYTIAFKYNYGTMEKPIVREFYLEGMDDEHAMYGVSCLENQKTHTKKYSIYSRFDVTKEDHKAYMEVWRQIYMAVVKHVFTIKTKVRLGGLRLDGLEEASHENPITGVVWPIHYGRYEDGTLKPGAKPGLYYRIQTGNRGTLFCAGNKDATEISRTILEHAEFDFVPLLHIYGITITGQGPTGSISSNLLSAVIDHKSMKPKATTIHQPATIRRLAGQDEDGTEDEFDAKLRAITLTMTPSTNEGQVTTGAPPSTNSGITKPPTTGRKDITPM